MKNRDNVLVYTYQQSVAMHPGDIHVARIMVTF
ncbi:hypothetical protein Bresa_01188|uniref:Uncharacterized protein n=1 Tax=Brenneria salicis ATCC 15712 = DSM 30166 TaxID=714314 RepID=A0A366IBB3_9GAMM|nr:hypothetical protein [Brenneria salicis ATCC 15712 = DSM 30166]RBP66559.1 hypothetical protein DES54_10388 [Brenneria salicis ATCC 15712 = DSM 30166]